MPMIKTGVPAARLADQVERIVLLMLFTFYAVRLLGTGAVTANPVNLLFLLDQAILIAFILVRRSTASISLSTRDWTIAFLGTVMPLMVQPAVIQPLLPYTVCAVLLVGGTTLQLSAKLVLRRSFGVVPANRGVKVSGPYRVVRHPMYAGYILGQLGFLLATPTVGNAVILLIAWGLQCARVHAEERLLKEDAGYRAFMAVTRYRLVPGIY